MNFTIGQSDRDNSSAETSSQIDLDFYKVDKNKTKQNNLTTANLKSTSFSHYVDCIF